MMQAALYDVESLAQMGRHFKAEEDVGPEIATMGEAARCMQASLFNCDWHQYSIRIGCVLF